MRQGLHRRGWSYRAAVVATTTVVLVVLLAMPALAAPAPTTWQVSPATLTITYGQGAILNGTLKSDSVALGGQWVDFAQATTEAGSYELIYKVTTSASAYSTGTYSVAVMPLQTMYYRFSWPGDATYATSNSNVIPVLVKPLLGTPTCPSSVTVSKKFTVKGKVEPGAPGGPTVKVKSYRQKSNGSWVGYKTYKAKISGTQASASIKITKTGKFKFKVSSVESTSYAAGLSADSKVLTVKD
jgi:hypothetical protein